MYNEDLGPNAPVITPIKVKVAVSITLSKTVEVEVNDYKINDNGFDENHDYYEDIDYSSCDLKKAVEEQITLPQNACIHMLPQTKVCKDLAGWNVDDFEVILE